MDTFTIKSSETKTSAKGTEYKRVTLTKSDGEEVKDVAVFKTFSLYGAVNPGATIAGNLKSSLYQGKVSYTLEDEIKSRGGAYKGNQGMIKEAVKEKNENIKAAQENKKDGIKVSGAQRDATLWITTFFQAEEWTNDERKAKWVEMKKFFMDQFDLPF